MHNIIYRMEEGDISYTIDKKSEVTWIFRVAVNDTTNLFHCHVSKINDDKCYVEIAHSSNNNPFRVTLKVRELFKILGFKQAYFKRSLYGEPHILNLSKGLRNGSQSK